MSLSKNALFKITLIFIPIVILIVFELFLRIFNLFPPEPLFIEKTISGKSYQQINPDVGRRYFNAKKMAVPRLYPQTFSSEKAENSLRVFCLGGSTTAGFPFDMTVPFPQQLQFIMQQAYKNKQVEVLNLGLSAINSYTVLDWMPDILENKPDLILIYMGHNEFYGAFGSASTIGVGQNGSIVRLYLKLQHLHIVQMLKSLLGVFSSESLNSSTTLMEQVISDPLIETDSKAFQSTQVNFQENLSLITEMIKDKDVPVIISSLVCNLQDQHPMESLITKPENAIADSFFISAEDQADLEKKYQLYENAKDADRLRFRAPSFINLTIRKIAEQPSITFLDMETIFRKASENTIPGNSLFCDHLHPNPDGYFLMAKAFFEKIILYPDFKPDYTHFSEKPYYVTPLDWEMGFIRLFKLKNQWPFARNEADYSQYQSYAGDRSQEIAYEFVFKHFNWVQAHYDMADYYKKTPQPQRTCPEYLAVHSMYPERIEPLWKLIDCYEHTRQWTAMENACKKAMQLTQKKGHIFLKLAIAEYNGGNIKSALQTIQYAIVAPENTADQKSEAELILARFLLGIKKKDDALKVLNDLLKSNPDFEPARKLLNSAN
ncbi:MAG: hypothetical protein H6627_07045 [Calditrichae bacterium]|nr:hypothetical protein [Calditrichia bacterium]